MCNTPTVVVEDLVASVKLSIDHLSEVTTKAKGYRKGAVAKSKSEQTNTSPSLKTNIEDVVLCIIQEGARERLPPPLRSTVVQGTIVSPLIQEEPRTIDNSFFPQVVVASEGESTS
ncbi:hypothetical protein K7X08_026324 [Anisodus acutangulus]|uniref:Uncharacterized protein n=1 Tax=Anisodus acutangulus TaxID=402998 RepID=A0A9Q1R5X9_9SOLA|nr:hypothetical protein K7X08_026324 [Anisodus acutangulus]